jgi:hypothetical protein
MRLNAYDEILRRQRKHLAQLATTRATALALTIIWAMNALNNRPRMSQAEKGLMRTCLPYRCVNVVPQDDMEGQEMPPGIPYNPYGLFFFRDILLDDCPRLPRVDTRPVDIEALPILLGRSKQLWAQISREIFSPIPITNSKRVQNRMKMTIRVPVPSDDEEESDVIMIDSEDDRHTVALRRGKAAPSAFHLEEEGHRIGPLPGAYNRFDDELEDDLGRINEAAAQIWAQFLVDLVHKSPNPKVAGRTSYLKLTAEERVNVTLSFYQTTQLRRIFTEVRLEKATANSWMTSFNNFFPIDGKKGHRMEGYKGMAYFQRYCELVQRISQEAQNSLRAKYRVLFDQMYWVPKNAADKVWLSNSKGGTLYPTQQEGGPAARIQGNPYYFNCLKW